MSDVNEYKNELLLLKKQEEDKTITVDWLGKCAEREPGKFINPILSELLIESKDKNKRLVMNFRNLEYIWI